MTSKLVCTRCGKVRVIAVGYNSTTMTDAKRVNIAEQIGWCVDGETVNCDDCNVELAKDYDEE